MTLLKQLPNTFGDAVAELPRMFERTWHWPHIVMEGFTSLELKGEEGGL